MRRRAWLAAATGLTVTFGAGCSWPVIPKRPRPEAEDALSWVRHENGRYTLFVPRAELGQNVLTALKQVACDELGIEWAQLDARLPATTDIALVRATVGSESIRDFALLAQACATLREALAAGQRQGRDGREAVAAQALRSLRGEGRYVGRGVPLEQAPAIVRCQPLYASDVRRPGLRYGRVRARRPRPAAEPPASGRRSRGAGGARFRRAGARPAAAPGRERGHRHRRRRPARWTASRPRWPHVGRCRAASARPTWTRCSTSING